MGTAAGAVGTHDWTSTPLGPVDDWPLWLRSAVDLVLALPLPAGVLWGDSLIVLPNDAFVRAVSPAPSPLGRPARTDEVFAGAETAFARVRDGETVTVQRPGPGAAPRSYSPLRDEQGRVAGILVVVTAPPTVRGASEELLTELHHQSRNALAFVRSVAKRTAATSANLADYAAHLDGRIDAFSRARSAAAVSPGGVDLAGLVAAELLAASAQEGEKATLDGPDVALKPRVAEILGLGIHELATNAVKFGALGVASGRIDVAWRTEDGRLVFEWKEAGVPGPLVADRHGFGLEVIERTLPYELNAETHHALEEDGVRCTIAMSLADATV